MRITVNINKKYAYVLIGLLILSAGIFIVNAFGGNQPSVAGHSVEEIDWSKSINKLNVNEICLNGKCINNWSDLEEETLINGVHVKSQCIASSGIIVGSGSNKFCRFLQSSCPSGWTQYNSWSETVQGSSNYISEYDGGGCPIDETSCKIRTDTCTTGSHIWADTARETKTCNGADAIGSMFFKQQSVCKGGYICGGKTDTTVYATITQIGCY